MFTLSVTIHHPNPRLRRIVRDEASTAQELSHRVESALSIPGVTRLILRAPGAPAVVRYWKES